MIIHSVYVCPNCLKSRHFNCVIENIIGEDENAKFYKPEYNVWCEECEEWMFDCDPDIRDIIILLNKKGYKTIFSCAGHHNKFDSIHISPHEICTIPYVSFRAPNETDSYLRNMIDEDEDYKKWINYNSAHTGDLDRRFSIYSGLSLMHELDESGEECSKEDWNSLRNTFFRFMKDFIEHIPDIASSKAN